MGMRIERGAETKAADSFASYTNYEVNNPSRTPITPELNRDASLQSPGYQDSGRDNYLDELATSESPKAAIMLAVLKAFNIINISSSDLSELFLTMQDTSNASIDALMNQAVQMQEGLTEFLKQQEDLKKQQEEAREKHSGLFGLITGLVEVVVGIATFIASDGTDPGALYMVTDGLCRTIGSACQMAGVENDYINSLAEHGAIGLVNCMSGNSLSEDEMQKMELGLALVMSASAAGGAMKGLTQLGGIAARVVIAANTGVMLAGAIVTSVKIDTGNETLNMFLASLSGGLPGVVGSGSSVVASKIMAACHADEETSMWVSMGLTILVTLAASYGMSKGIAKSSGNSKMDYKKDIAAEKVKVEKAEARVKPKEYELKAAKAKQAAADTELKAAEKKLNETAEPLKQAEAEFNEKKVVLIKELDTAEKEFADIQKKKAQYDTEVAELEKADKPKESDLEAAKAKQAAAEIELKTAEEKLKETAKQLKQTEAEFNEKKDGLIKELDTAEKEFADIQKKKAQCDAEVVKLEKADAKVKHKESELEEAKEELDTAKEELYTAEKKLESAGKKLKETTDKFDKAKAELDEKTVALSKATADKVPEAELDAAKKELANAKIGSETAEKELDAAKKESDAAQTKLAEIQKKKAECDTAVAAKEAELENTELEEYGLEKAAFRKAKVEDAKRKVNILELEQKQERVDDEIYQEAHKKDSVEVQEESLNKAEANLEEAKEKLREAADELDKLKNVSPKPDQTDLELAEQNVRLKQSEVTKLEKEVGKINRLLNITEAEKALQDAITNRLLNITEAERALQDAITAEKNANTAVTTKKKEQIDLEAEIKTKEEESKKLLSAIENIEAKKNELGAPEEASTTDLSKVEELTKKHAELEELAKKYTELKKSLADVNTDLDKLKPELDVVKEEIKAKQKMLDGAKEEIKNKRAMLDYAKGQLNQEHGFEMKKAKATLEKAEKKFAEISRLERAREDVKSTLSAKKDFYLDADNEGLKRFIPKVQNVVNNATIVIAVMEITNANRNFNTGEKEQSMAVFDKEIQDIKAQAENLQKKVDLLKEEISNATKQLQEKVNDTVVSLITMLSDATEKLEATLKRLIDKYANMCRGNL